MTHSPTLQKLQSCALFIGIYVVSNIIAVSTLTWISLGSAHPTHLALAILPITLIYSVPPIWIATLIPKNSKSWRFPAILITRTAIEITMYLPLFGKAPFLSLLGMLGISLATLTIFSLLAWTISQRLSPMDGRESKKMT